MDLPRIYLKQLAYQSKLKKALDIAREQYTPPGLDFSEFKQRVWRGYRPGPFHPLLDKHLNSIADYLRTGGKQGINRLQINLPPRYTKTLNVSRYFPAYILGEMPYTSIILASYGATLATKNSRFVRSVIQRLDYQNIYSKIELSKDRAAAHEWYLENYGGGVFSAGVDGGVTGQGANLIIIDDPIKGRAEAESPTYREKLEDWYLNDLYTRREGSDCIILMNTRWHYDDLNGRLLEENVDGWVNLILPALAGENDPLGREPGEALWPEEKHTRQELLQIRDQIGEYAFESLYQQNPQKSKGGLFDTELIKPRDVLPDTVRTVRFWDLAVTEKTRADYTVGLKMGLLPDEGIAVMDIVRVQKEIPDVHKLIVQTAKLDGTDTEIVLEAEKAGITEFQYLLRDPDMQGYTISTQTPEGDKYTRAGPFASRVKGGRVMIQAGPNVRAYLNELSMFPAGANDDQVDASSGAYKTLVEPEKQKPVFTQWNIHRHSSTTLQPDHNEPIIWAVRDGGSEGDGLGSETYQPRVIIIGQVVNGTLYILDEHVAVSETHDDSIEAALNKSTMPAVAYVDPDAEVLKQALWRHGIQTSSVKVDLIEGIRNVRMLLTNDRLQVDPRCTYTIYEFEHYRADKTGRHKHGEPVPEDKNNRALGSIQQMAWHLRYE